MKFSYFIEIEIMWIFNKFECFNDGIYYVYLLLIISFMCNRYYLFYCKYIFWIKKLKKLIKRFIDMFFCFCLWLDVYFIFL